MILYHYTCLEHLESILQAGEIKLTASNLLRPVNPQVINGNVVDVTDDYKPVVWFTSVLDFGKARNCGLNGSGADKTEVAITFEPKGNQTAPKWSTWAKKHQIEREWFNDLKAAAPEWENFYITEYPVKITEQTKIIFRPDIAAALLQARKEL